MAQHFSYMNKNNRDGKYKELKLQGYKVRRTSIRNQLLHPMYIIDYPNKEVQQDQGVFNTVYKTYFSVIYTVEILEYPRSW